MPPPPPEVPPEAYSRNRPQVRPPPAGRQYDFPTLLPSESQTEQLSQQFGTRHQATQTTQHGQLQNHPLRRQHATQDNYSQTYPAQSQSPEWDHRRGVREEGEMGSRSDNIKNLVTVAGTVIGAGIAVGGAVFAAYQYFSNRSNENHTNNENQKKKPPPPDSHKNCPLCDKVIETEKAFFLECGHAYHKECILANYVLHYNEERFVCPLNDCKCPVSDHTKNVLCGNE